MAKIYIDVENGELKSVSELKEALKEISNAACGICDQEDYHGNYRVYEAFRAEAEHWLEAAIEAKLNKGQEE